MNRTSARVALLSAASFAALAIASPVSAKSTDYRIGDADRASASEAIRSMVTETNIWAPDLRIVTNDGPFIKPGPGSTTAIKYANSKQVLDASGVNGVGQQIAIIQDQNAFGQGTGAGVYLGLCTGTLINPRTVITAAHCLFDKPAHYYGSDTGAGGGITGQSGLPKSTGIPLSFGFSPTNRCINTNGCASGTGPYEAWRDSGYESQPDKFIYNANQVWYARESQPVEFGGGGEFGNKDIALVTLDTHVENVPTWTLLFSPLTGPTHVTITGYGAAGVGTPGIGDAAGIDYRRRVAENMIDALMSSADWIHTPAIAGPDFHAFDNEAHSMYWFDFDDPRYNPKKLPSNSAFLPENENVDAALLNWDFNGLGGTALPREGTTAGGDSGGPLIVDQTFRNPDGTFKPVVAGVLTGGWSFNGGIGTYGEFSVYPPLFLFWQDIVRQNPYKYVSAKAGNGNWFDPSHWVQDMDPNYAISVNGQLVNSLPSHAQISQDSTAGRFGRVCFFGTDCGTITGTPYPSDAGQYLLTAGGPGTTNFVPNNVEPVNSPSASQHTWARYYDVTLNKTGTTTLDRTATIDKLTVSGSANLDVTSTGHLNVWSDFIQTGGIVNVNGTLSTGEAFVGAGILSGSGTFDPTYATVLRGAVAPGGANVGTLTVKGNMVMSSASGLLIDVSAKGSDQLRIIGDDGQAGILAFDGSLLINRAPGASAARYGDSFVIASAEGGLQGAFASAGTYSGVLKPNLSYGAGQITMALDAGSLASMVGSDKTALAFASALDQLRGSSYGKLWNLYGNVDWMNAGQLSATFSALSPTNIVGEMRLMQDRQSAKLLGNVGDRLSLMGTGRAEGISFTGGASALALSREGMSASAQLGLTDGQSARIAAPGGLSGFVAMGGDTIGASYGGGEQTGQHSRYFASGIEAPFGDAMIGTAIGFAETRSMAGNDEAKSKVSQAAAYASLPVGKSAYIGGVVAAERASSDSNRLTTDTTSMFRLSGATHSARYMANLEAGVRKSIGSGLYFNPRAQLGVSHYALGGFKETGGETALALDTLEVNRIESRFGARLDGTAKLGGWSVRPNLQADYVRLLAGGDAGLKVAFAAAPAYSFALPLVGGGSGWMEVKGGLELSRGKFSLGLSGQATAGDAPIADQRGAVDLSFRF